MGTRNARWLAQSAAEIVVEFREPDTVADLDAALDMLLRDGPADRTVIIDAVLGGDLDVAGALGRLVVGHLIAGHGLGLRHRWAIAVDPVTRVVGDRVLGALLGGIDGDLPFTTSAIPEISCITGRFRGSVVRMCRLWDRSGRPQED
jgi:hypothetical protein